MAIPPRVRRRSISSMMGSPGSPSRRPSSLLPSPSEQGGILRRRISSMFTSDGDPGSPRQPFALEPDVTEPEPEPFKDRDAIKVKIITWNMADSIPKGDLSVLLGEIPQSGYDLLPRGDDIPELPLEDVHPYHIVVFAAQECPSASGMPRGLGGSLMKGVGLQKSDAARRERDDKKEEHGEKRRQEKETEKGAKKVIREIRKDFLERSATDKDALQAIKELRKEYKEREGSAATLKDIIGKDKDTREKEKEKNARLSGLGLNVSSLADDVSEKSRTAVIAESSSGSDSTSSEEVQTNSHAHTLDKDNAAAASEDIDVANQATVPNPNGAAGLPSPKVVPLVVSPPAAVQRSNGVAVPGSTDGVQTDTPVISSNGDSVSPASEPADPTPIQGVKDHNGEQSPPLALPTPIPPVKEKPSREKLRIDPQYKRKADSKDTLGSARSLTAFDIGLGSPMTDLAGAIGRKGWSHMLEEWFCAGPPNLCRDLSSVTSTPMSGSDISSHRINGDSLSPSGTGQPAPSHHRAWSTSHKRSSSMRSINRATSVEQSVQIPAPVANGNLGVPSVPFGRPLSGHSIQSLDTVASSLLSSQEDRQFGRSPGVREMGRSPAVFDSPIMDESPVKRFCRQPGAGPYVQLIKERLMGLYVHVFVYKGCEHLVEGVDKDFVRTGLAGGRIGNKGGIGISLNLKGHRLLFVNAHLAAHAECNDDRIANIDKIKLELRPNCFLPQDDPRAAMPDITDRFDTTFWCGDLNFRVDISHLHSKWLLKEGRYITQAQEWDQLKIIMNDPKKNPLPGFEEAEITFMPTFKYDIWKPAGSTKRDKRRSIRRSRRSSDQSTRPSMDRMDRPSSPRLDGVPEIDVVEESSSAPESPEITHTILHGQPVMSPVPETPPLMEVPLPDELSLASNSADHSHASLLDRSREPTPGGASRQSTATYRSQRSDRVLGSTGGPSPSLREMTPMTPTSEDTRRASGAWSRGTSRSATEILSTSAGATKRSGTTLKAKTQKLINIMRLGRKPAVRPVELTLPHDASRRSSVSSFRSRGVSESRLSVVSDDQPPVPGAGTSSPRMPRVSMDSDLAPTPPGIVLPDGEPVYRASSPQSAYSVGGRRLASPPRRPRGLIRSFSGRDLSEDVDEEEVDTVDTRTGVYDTSKKGRIPSWCDRVLWKTHVIPDLVDDPATHIDDDDSVASNGPFMRLSNVFTTLSGRMRRRSSFYGDMDTPRMLFPRLTSSTSVPYGLVASIPDDHTIPPDQRIARDNSTPTKSVPPDQVIPREQNIPISQDEEVFESDPPTPADGEAPTPDSSEQLNGIMGLSPHPADIRSLPLQRNRGLSVTFEDSPPLQPQTWRRDLPTTAEAPAIPAPLPQNSIGLGPSPLAQRLSQGRRASNATDSTSSRHQSIARRLSMSSIGSIGSSGSRTRRRSDDVSYLRDGSSAQLHPFKTVRNSGQVGDPGNRPHRGSDGGLGLVDAPYGGLNALTRFFRGLPGRFHSRVSLFHGSEAEVEEAVVEVPRRHLVGEVQILHYGTLEDAEMRRLEGRSDHYPLIFSAAVFI
ncbi:hypothetical protein CspHIS471_0507000 [Cutaneotrichosporon sp. HIS471]|nr:hypothetical protein CspHIS471_0507000 [Cutaneotrichosporon sp. HIS471]